MGASGLEASIIHFLNGRVGKVERVERYKL